MCCLCLQAPNEQGTKLKGVLAKQSVDLAAWYLTRSHSLIVSPLLCSIQLQMSEEQAIKLKADY
jgi:hypothetical protein